MILFNFLMTRFPNYVLTTQDKMIYLIKMTMTSPTCPLAEDVVNDVNNAVSDAPGVKGVQIELTFEPEWDESRMSEEARLELGLM